MKKKYIFLFLIFVLLIFLNRNVLIYRPLLNYVTTKTTTAKIINKKEFSRRGYINGAFNYYYEFNVADKKYGNPSYNENYKIGDLVIVVYSERFPFMNKIIK